MKSTALIIALLICSNIGRSASAQEAKPLMILGRDMQPEYLLVTDLDGSIRRVSERREYPDDGRNCDPGWREIQRIAGLLLCGKRMRAHAR